MSEHTHQSFDSELSAAGFRFAIVVSRFNSFVTDPLLAGALEALKQQGADLTRVDVVHVPGAWELPITVRAIAQHPVRKPDAIICLGAVIKGDTPHFDYVAGEAARGIAAASADTGVPMAFGVLTTNTVEQAVRPSRWQGRQQGFRRSHDGDRNGELAAEIASHKLMARHRARQQALQLLFQWDLRRTPIEDIIRGYYDSLLVSEDSVGRPRAG